MSTTPRLGWTIPNVYEEEWAGKMTSALYSMDAAAYASSENDNLFFMHGGLVFFDAGADLMTWSATIEIATSSSQYLILIESGAITIADNQWLYIVVPRQLRQQTTITFLISNSYIPAAGSNIHDYIGVARRRGSTLYFRTGTVLQSGQSAPIFSMPIHPSSISHQHIDQVTLAVGGETYIDIPYTSPELVGVELYRNGVRNVGGADYTVSLALGRVTFAPPAPAALAGERLLVEMLMSAPTAHQHIDQTADMIGGETSIVLGQQSPQLISVHFYRNGLRGAINTDYTVDAVLGILTFSPPGIVAAAGERVTVSKVLTS